MGNSVFELEKTNILMAPFTFLTKETITSISDKNLTDLAVNIKRTDRNDPKAGLVIVTAPNNLFGKVVQFIFGALGTTKGKAIKKIKDNLDAQYGAGFANEIFNRHGFHALEENNKRLSVVDIKKIYSLAEVLSQSKEVETNSTVSTENLTQDLTHSESSSTPLRPRSNSERAPQFQKNNTAVSPRNRSQSLGSAASEQTSLSSISQSVLSTPNTPLSHKNFNDAESRIETSSADDDFFEAPAQVATTATQELMHDEPQNNISTSRRRSQSEPLPSKEIDDDFPLVSSLEEKTMRELQGQNKSKEKEAALKDFHSPTIFPEDKNSNKRSRAALEEHDDSDASKRARLLDPEDDDDFSPSLPLYNLSHLRDQKKSSRDQTDLETSEDDLETFHSPTIFPEAISEEISELASEEAALRKAQEPELPSDLIPTADAAPEPATSSTLTAATKPSEKKRGNVADFLTTKKKNDLEEKLQETITNLKSVPAAPIDPVKEALIAGLRGSYQEFFGKLKKLKKDILESQKEIEEKRKIKDEALKNKDLIGNKIHVENADALKASEQRHLELINEQRALQAEQDNVVEQLKKEGTSFDELGNTV